MSLVGNLEDLGLGEILQIVSLSRKTGVLSISSKGRDGSIYFRQGQVVRAASSTYQQSLGEVLVQKGIIDLAILRKALSLQQQDGFSKRLGTILVKNFGISLEIVEQVVREQIEGVVFSLFTWSTGRFEFDVQDTIDSADSTRMDPMQFMLDQGLNPQFLAIEGSRLFDEQQHAARMKYSDAFSADDITADFSLDLAPPSDKSATYQPPLQQPVVMVDDDGPTLRAIADGLITSGFAVHAMTRSEDTLVKVDNLCRSGAQPIVLIDLIMPKMDGSGVLGGIELLELLNSNFSTLQFIVMSDYHHADAEQKVHDLGYPCIIKPRRSEISNQAILQNFIAQLVHDIRHSSEDEAAHAWEERFNLGDELRIEMGDDTDLPDSGDSNSGNVGLSLLRGMLEELNNPDLQGGVLLLVLRFASEFMNRAIVFTICDQIISGTGQFGISGGRVSGDERVRAIHVPQEAESLFREPLRSGQARTVRPVPTVLDTHIFEQLGGGIPEEVFIGPIISQSRVIGFLYGDNLPDQRPVGDLESLVIFLSQAGIAMEKSLLERQLLERTTP